MLGGPDSTNFLLVVVQEAIQLLNLRQTILAKEERPGGGLKEGGFDVPFRHSSGFKQMCGCGRIEEKEGEGEKNEE